MRMRCIDRSILTLLLLALGACLSAGCSDKGTEPENPSPSTGMRHIWSKRFGDAYAEYASAAAVDTSGSMFVAGDFNGTLDFGGGALTSAGYDDIFMVKLGSDGAYSWSKRFGDADVQHARAIAVDAAGSVIATGDFYGTIDFGGGTLTSAGYDDIFIVKLGSDGAYLWSKRFGDGDGQRARAVAVDASGDVVVTGPFWGTIDFGGGPLTSAGSDDIFVAKLASDGAYLWSKSFGDAGDQEGKAVVVDALGNVIVTGDFFGTIDFGAGPLTSAGGDDIFVAKFGPDGSHQWSKRFGGGSDQNVNAVAVDPSGNVIITGDFYSTVDFGGGALTSTGRRDIFVAKFGPDGAHLWSKRFGNGIDQDQYGKAVAVDALGNVIVTGWFSGSANFGGSTLISAGSYDIFVAEFGSDGAHLWSKRFGDENDQYACAVAADALGSAIVAGYLGGTVDFGGGALTSAGSWDIFIAKYGW
jgi:hypothetical protein